MNYIVCPVRNCSSFTKAAFKTFRAQDIGPTCTILIDNDSTDDTGAWARSQDGLLYWHRKPGLSVAKSWNLALDWLFRGTVPRAQYALVVNNDTLLKESTYRLLLEDGGQFVTATGVNNMEQFNQEPEPHKKRPHPDFSCYLIRRECWQTVGPFDEHYQNAFLEDNDYHVRMHRLGIDAHCIGLPFYHYGSATIKSADEKEQKRIADAAGRNRELFFSRYGCYPGTPEYEALFTPIAVEE